MKTYISILISISVMLLITACGGGGGGGGGSTPASSYNITGTVMKGTAIEGSVTAYQADGKVIGTDSSLDLDGKYSIPSKNYEGVVRVVATLTKYTDEDTNQTVNVDNLELESISYIF
jgi:hypothetical protein